MLGLIRLSGCRGLAPRDVALVHPQRLTLRALQKPPRSLLRHPRGTALQQAPPTRLASADCCVTTPFAAGGGYITARFATYDC